MAKRKTEQKHFDGMEPPRIGPLTAAIRRAHERAGERAEAQKAENEARDKVIELMEQHHDDLLCPETGQLIYKVDEITAVITPRKKLKVSIIKNVEAQEASKGAEDGIDTDED